MKSAQEYKVLGIMSGTSLDGTDLACVVIRQENESWSFELIKGETLPYPDQLKMELKNSIHINSMQLQELNVRLGRYFGELASDFINRNNVNPDFIASHGHTVFHQPSKGYTLQIGDGNFISLATKLPVIYDFRSLDVALGGQGAPLVPIGDRLLFSQYSACINLGGFSNISAEIEGKRIAYDMGPTNIILNHYSNLLGMPFDQNGKFGRKGVVVKELLDDLNRLPYYLQLYPKSLGFEWVEETVFPIINKYTSSSYVDILSTLYEHISDIITQDLNKLGISGKILMTGGGAFNTFLIQKIREKAGSNIQIIIPEKDLINYKEAIVFALLGVLRWNNLPNCLSSVTGALRDSSGGVIVFTN